MISITTNRHDLAIAEAGITVIFGPTGVGKTTLLRQIAGHLPLSGSLRIGTESIADNDKEVIPQERGFAYVSQSSSLVRQFTVSRNLQLAIEAARSDLSEQDIESIYALCQIEHLLSRRADQVSGGESQQICLAMALLSQPRLLLLDEPMSALDMRRKYEILSRFKLWLEQRNIPAIYVSHDVNEVALVADNMVVLSADKPAQMRTYQAWLADVNSDFVTHGLAVNSLHAHYVRTEHDLNLMSLSETPEVTFWAQGQIDHELDYVVELPMTDVSLSLEPMPESSILNQLEAQIKAISEPVSGYQFVSLAVANETITARLTAFSVAHLQLSEGQSCFACFKTPRVLPIRK